MWNNLKNNLPPKGEPVLISIVGKYFIGSLDAAGQLIVSGYKPDGILTCDVWWQPITSAPQPPL